ncbi:unnamed protein product [Wickerhamomyces anomalus]
MVSKDHSPPPKAHKKHKQLQKIKSTSPTRQNISPILKPIDQYLDDLNDSYITDFKSDIYSNISIVSSDIDRLSQSFNSKVKRHYQYLVKLLPILIIFLPSLLKIFFPKIIKFGNLEIGDNNNNPSNILIDFFSILLICWIIKFLLDWPWKWYSQINEIKQKLYTLLESDVNSNKDFTKLTNQSLTILKIQQIVSLIMCIGSPFLSGVLLVLARDYIVVIVIIQISEHIQQSTASIEIKTEKLISDSNHKNSLEIERNNSNRDSNMILDRLNHVEQQLNQLTQKFDNFYNTNKLSIDKNLTFLSSKHFKILEKEINELHFNLHTKTNDLDNKIHTMMISQDQSPQKTTNTQHSSLHGIPLSPKKPSYIGGGSNSNNSFFPLEQYSKFSKQLPSPLSRLGQFFPLLDDSDSSDGNDKASNEIAIKELSNLDAIHKYDLTSRPIVEYLLNFPFLFRKLVWKLISYVPLSVLKSIYFILLSILDILLAKANTNNDENDEMKVKLINKQHEPLFDESFEEIITR